MNNSMMASSTSSSNVNNNFLINFIAYTRSGQKNILYMPQLVGQLKGNDLIKNKKMVVSGHLIKIGIFVLVQKHQV